MRKTLRTITRGAIGTALLLGSFALATQVSAEDKAYRNVMYYGDWSIEETQGHFLPKDIPADKLTHLNFAFLDFDVDGSLKWTDDFAALDIETSESIATGAANAGLLNALQDLRLKNPNLKLGVSVGGWTKSGDFALNAQDPAKRAKLVANLIKFVRYNELDFLDIDWEYPGAVRDGDLVDSAKDEGTPNASEADRQNYVTLLTELHNGLKELGKTTGKTYELSVALAAGPYTLNQGTDIPSVFNIVDFANVMTYDIHGAWENTSNHHTALYTNPKAPQGDGKPWSFSINDSVNYYLSNGAIANKLVIGAAFYSRGWGNVENDGFDPKNQPGLFGNADFATKDADGNPSRGAENENPLINGDGGRNGGIWSYRNFDQLKVKYPDLTEYWDDAAKAPFMYSAKDKVFFTYDNERSLTEKANYVKEKNLGGMITWMQSQDAPSDPASTRRDVLTTAIYNGLYGGAALVQHDLVTANLSLSANIVTSSDYKLTLTNSEEVTETDAVLKAVELKHKTVKNGQLYIQADEALSYKGTALPTVVVENITYYVLDFENVALAPNESLEIILTPNLGDGVQVASGIKKLAFTQKIDINSLAYGFTEITFKNKIEVPTTDGNDQNDGKDDADTTDKAENSDNTDKKDNTGNTKKTPNLPATGEVISLTALVFGVIIISGVAYLKLNTKRTVK
ncbi:chitinase [Lactococcus hodotermopsidis]|uniref:chitinase n=1 Tax=Pseudolactococcus hodotermopsidis TaxID=2709157 RepID=A0A6A0BE63_9LACT|nr:glycosyl hydrolase family 18 protein [Lactococcus hodotermopsidis]GFH42641.1 chitinase [Lactococcus hodotermopsidis]